MEPILEDVANRLESEAKVAKVDTDKAPKLGHKYQVRVMTIICFHMVVINVKAIMMIMQIVMLIMMTMRTTSLMAMMIIKLIIIIIIIIIIKIIKNVIILTKTQLRNNCSSGSKNSHYHCQTSSQLGFASY